MRKFIDLTGQRFGRLVVVSKAENSNSGHARWNCICDCGVEAIVFGCNLRSGCTKSCGCLQREKTSETNITHGMTKTPTHITWKSMKQRCTDHKYSCYENYGGRGIAVCGRWNKFDNFYEDMGKRPNGTSLERIDNNGNYCPENCCWATPKTQNRNTRRNRIIEYDGKSQCLSAWAEELEINYETLRKRLQNHPPQIAFNM